MLVSQTSKSLNNMLMRITSVNVNFELKSSRMVGGKLMLCVTSNACVCCNNIKTL